MHPYSDHPPCRQIWSWQHSSTPPRSSSQKHPRKSNHNSSAHTKVMLIHLLEWPEVCSSCSCVSLLAITGLELKEMTLVVCQVYITLLWPKKLLELQLQHKLQIHWPPMYLGTLIESIIMEILLPIVSTISNKWTSLIGLATNVYIDLNLFSLVWARVRVQVKMSEITVQKSGYAIKPDMYTGCQQCTAINPY